MQLYSEEWICRQQKPHCQIVPHVMEARKRRHGRDPPLKVFTGEDPEVRLEDWIAGLKRDADWNDWNEEELLLQLAGRALQEWNLLPPFHTGTATRVRTRV